MKIINKYEEEIEINLGDWVGFKSDIEQHGQVVSMNKYMVTLENEDGFIGDYIGGDTIADVHANDVYLD